MAMVGAKNTAIVIMTTIMMIVTAISMYAESLNSM